MIFDFFRIFLLVFPEASEMGTITDGPGNNGGAAEKGSECLTGEEKWEGFPQFHWYMLKGRT